MTKKRDQDTNATYHPLKSYAWGAAAQLERIALENDPDLWEAFFEFCREREILDDLKQRLAFEFGDEPPEAAE
jgi:hypothetical protein